MRKALTFASAALSLLVLIIGLAYTLNDLLLGVAGAVLFFSCRQMVGAYTYSTMKIELLSAVLAIAYLCTRVEPALGRVLVGLGQGLTAVVIYGFLAGDFFGYKEGTENDEHFDGADQKGSSGDTAS